MKDKYERSPIEPYLDARKVAEQYAEGPGQAVSKHLTPPADPVRYSVTLTLHLTGYRCWNDDGTGEFHCQHYVCERVKEAFAHSAFPKPVEIISATVERIEREPTVEELKSEVAMLRAIVAARGNVK